MPPSLSRKILPSWRAALGACALAAAPLAGAQQAAIPSPPARVEIRGDAAYDPRRDDTAAKIVVGNAELVKYGDASVAEALKRVAGVTVTSTGLGSDVRMRGLGAGYTQILVNGARAPFGFSIDALSPQQVERIEVIPSASAEFSTQSIAGTINIVLKKTARTRERQLQAGYGGNATERTPRALLLLSDRVGALSGSLSANARHTTFDRAGSILDTAADGAGRATVLQTTGSAETGRFDFASIVPRLGWTLAGGDTLSFESMLSWTRFRYAAHRLTASLLGPAPAYPALDLAIGTRSAFVQSDLAWNTRLDPDTRLEAKLGMQGSDGSNDSARTAAAAGTGTPLRNAIAVALRERGWNGSGKWCRKAGQAHQLTAGWEASETRRDERNAESNAGVAAPLLAAYGGRLARAAAFVQDEWTVDAGWSLYLGLRGERLATQVDGAPPVPSAQLWSPIVQALIKLPRLPDDRLRLAFTRTFKAPELGSLLPRIRRYEVNAATNPDLQGNPALRPERAGGIDAGVEHDLGKNALVSIAASIREIADTTESEISQGGDGRWVARPVNAGRAHLRSLALEAKLPLSPHGFGPPIQLHASLSRNWSCVDDVPAPGNRVAEQIPLSALLALDRDTGALNVGASLQFRRGAWIRLADQQSTQTWARRDLDLYALWKLDASQQLRVTLGNLLAQETAAASAYAGADGIGRRVTDAPGHRSIRALFERKF